jgi:hypothetical protein
MYRSLNCDLSSTRKSKEASRYFLIFMETNGRTCNGLMCPKSEVPSVFNSGNVICMYVLASLRISRVRSTDWGVKNFFQDKTLVTQILYYNGYWPRLCQIKGLLLNLVHEHIWTTQKSWVDYCLPRHTVVFFYIMRCRRPEEHLLSAIVRTQNLLKYLLNTVLLFQVHGSVHRR